jgi:hypothetical protein
LTVGCRQRLAQVTDEVPQIDHLQVLGLHEFLVDQTQGIDPVSQLPQAFRGNWNLADLKGEQRVHNLKIVLDPVVDFPQQGFLLG